jgi:hypothetical protein
MPLLTDSGFWYLTGFYLIKWMLFDAANDYDDKVDDDDDDNL